MRKIAIFVEGMTEQEFVVAFIAELIGNRGIHFELAHQLNGVVVISSVPVVPLADFYVLVIDCRCDGQVKTQMRERYQLLVKAGYTAILGIRDVYPLSRSDIPKIEKTLDLNWPVGPVIPKLHLAVMEVEAWFIANVSHFERVSKELTPEYLLEKGYDVENIAAEDWNHPAGDLNNMYRLANKAYITATGQKKRRRIMRTINALSFDELYAEVRPKVPSLNSFIDSVEKALF